MDRETKIDCSVELYEWSENNLQTDLTLDDCVRIVMWCEGKEVGTSEKDLRVCEVIANACECLPEWRKTKIEENAFPYGDNLSFDECEKCGHKWNIHVV